MWYTDRVPTYHKWFLYSISIMPCKLFSYWKYDSPIEAVGQTQYLNQANTWTTLNQADTWTTLSWLEWGWCQTSPQHEIMFERPWTKCWKSLKAIILCLHGHPEGLISFRVRRSLGQRGLGHLTGYSNSSCFEHYKFSHLITFLPTVFSYWPWFSGNFGRT